MRLRRQVIPVMLGALAAFGCSGTDSSPSSAAGGNPASSGGSPSSNGAAAGATSGAAAAGAPEIAGGSDAGGGSPSAVAGSADTAGAVDSSAGSNAVAGESSLGGANGASGASGSSGGANSTGGAAAGRGGAFSGPSYPYIMSCFDDDNTHPSDLIIYKSNDALNWTLLYDTGYTGPTGFMRDPSIMRHTDGKYYVAFTTPPDLGCCSPQKSFAIASSSNLKDWTTIATVPGGVPSAKNTWSPEWFVDTDGSVHLTDTMAYTGYHYEPTDATLTKWSGPKPLGISGSIDYQILKIGNTYHSITADRHGTASSLDGPWTFGQYKVPACKEGPAMVHISGDTWRYYCDDGGNGHERSSLTTDAFQTWSPLETLPVVGNDISQGTVIRGDTGHPF